MSGWPGQEDFAQALQGIKALSQNKMQRIIDLCVTHYKSYKFVIHDLEKFLRKMKQKYRVSGLYTVDAIIRQVPKKLGSKDPYRARLEKHMPAIFRSIVYVTAPEAAKVEKVLNIWKEVKALPPSVLDECTEAFEEARTTGFRVEDEEEEPRHHTSQSFQQVVVPGVDIGSNTNVATAPPPTSFYDFSYDDDDDEQRLEEQRQMLALQRQQLEHRPAQSETTEQHVDNAADYGAAHQPQPTDPYQSATPHDPYQQAAPHDPYQAAAPHDPYQAAAGPHTTMYANAGAQGHPHADYAQQPYPAQPPTDPYYASVSYGNEQYPPAAESLAAPVAADPRARDPRQRAQPDSAPNPTEYPDTTGAASGAYADGGMKRGGTQQGPQAKRPRFNQGLYATQTHGDEASTGAPSQGPPMGLPPPPPAPVGGSTAFPPPTHAQTTPYQQYPPYGAPTAPAPSMPAQANAASGTSSAPPYAADQQNRGRVRCQGYVLPTGVPPGPDGRILVLSTSLWIGTGSMPVTHALMEGILRNFGAVLGLRSKDGYHFVRMGSRAAARAAREALMTHALDMATCTLVSTDKIDNAAVVPVRVSWSKGKDISDDNFAQNTGASWLTQAFLDAAGGAPVETVPEAEVAEAMADVVGKRGKKQGGWQAPAQRAVRGGGAPDAGIVQQHHQQQQQQQYAASGEAQSAGTYAYPYQYPQQGQYAANAYQAPNSTTGNMPPPPGPPPASNGPTGQHQQYAQQYSYVHPYQPASDASAVHGTQPQGSWGGAGGE